MRWFLFIHFFLCTFLLSAQEITLKADKTEILMGQPLTLQFETQDAQLMQSKISFDSIQHFEWIKDSSWQEQKNGVKTFIKQMVITSFDEGDWLIPPIKIGHYKTNAIFIKVRYSKGFNAALPYHDIKDIENPPPSKQNLKWIYFTIVTLFFIIIIYFISKWRKINQQNKVNVENKPVIADYYTYTLEEIEKINQLKNKPTQYITQLIDLFRNYIFHTTGIQSLHQTSNDVAIQLKKYYVDAEAYQKLKHHLSISDLVKFAKLTISTEELENIKKGIVEGIHTIQQIKQHTTNKE